MNKSDTILHGHWSTQWLPIWLVLLTHSCTTSHACLWIPINFERKIWLLFCYDEQLCKELKRGLFLTAGNLFNFPLPRCNLVIILTWNDMKIFDGSAFLNLYEIGLEGHLNIWTFRWIPSWIWSCCSQPQSHHGWIVLAELKLYWISPLSRNAWKKYK